jgi:hypothetical protein
MFQNSQIKLRAYQRHALFLGCALMLAALAAACQPAQASRSDVSPALPEITIKIGDAAIQAPVEMPAGLVAVTILDERTQPKDGAPILVRLADGVTMEQASTGELPAEMATMLGGHLGRSIFDLAEGDYFVMWGSPEEGPHPAPASFSVQGGERQLMEPQADVQVELRDFTFVLPDEIESGEQIWQISNAGGQWHHLLLWKLNEGVTDEQFMAWLMQEESQGPPPAALFMDWAPSHPGVMAWAEVDLSPGNYYVICFLPDFSANPPMPHVAHGMVRKLVVK